jgi:hypothetical protein
VDAGWVGASEAAHIMGVSVSRVRQTFYDPRERARWWERGDKRAWRPVPLSTTRIQVLRGWVEAYADGEMSTPRKDGTT